MKNTFKLLSFFLLVFFSSCKKEIQERQDKTIFLTKPSGWLTSKYEQQVSGQWIDITSTITPFDADNLLIFDPWGGWAIHEGALKLPGNAQVPFSGEWSFEEYETKIQLKQGDRVANLMQIIELTENSFQVLVNDRGTTLRYTYKHP
ncbi:MAG: hypothetical protein EOO90_10905 [Pedobacter sp.]|nr:MAG: hypothetical protein EOO90_10905 [Pedobacter sp.]